MLPKQIKWTRFGMCTVQAEWAGVCVAPVLDGVWRSAVVEATVNTHGVIWVPAVCSVASCVRAVVDVIVVAVWIHVVIRVWGLGYQHLLSILTVIHWGVVLVVPVIHWGVVCAGACLCWLVVTEGACKPDEWHVLKRHQHVLGTSIRHQHAGRSHHHDLFTNN